MAPAGRHAVAATRGFLTEVGLPDFEPTWGLECVPDRTDRTLTRELDEPNRDLVRDHHQTGHPPGTFTSVNELIHRIRTYVEHWNTDARPFTWTATADNILAKVRWVQTNVKQLVANNSK